MPLDSSLRNAIIAISIIALLIVIVAITVLPIGQAQNASGAGGTFATTGGCGAGSFVTTVGNTTIACSAYPAQTNEYYGSCPANQFATAVTTTTLNCATALTTQTSAFFNYGSCPNAGMAATAVTTTTLNCATFLTTQTSQVQTSAFFSYGSCPASNWVNAITTSTLNCSGFPDPIFAANSSTNTNSVTGTTPATTGLEFQMAANTYYTFSAYTYVTASTATDFDFSIPATSVPLDGHLYYACAESILLSTTSDCATATATAFGTSTANGLLGSVILHGAITTSPNSVCPCYFIIDFAATVSLKTVSLGPGEYIISYTSP